MRKSLFINDRFIYRKMKIKWIMTVVLAVCTGYGQACTNLIVGKKASADGSVIVSYSADDFGSFGYLRHWAAGKHAKGAMRPVYNWENNNYAGEIEEAPETYNVIGNMNEYQLTITETTFGGRAELVDSTGLLDYGSLIYITLQRAKTAKEAIGVMTELINKYGYNSEGESFTIADKNEAWVMDLIGKGTGRKGAVWVAVRVPDDCICAHANQSRIRRFPLRDKENCLYSKDVISFAREKGYFKGKKDSDFSFADAYAPADFSALRFCEARVWSFFNRYVDGMTYFNERPISTQQSAFVMVAQMRSQLPDYVGGVLWFGCDDANMMAFTPVYCCTDLVPECYSDKVADDLHFSFKSAFWVCNWVSSIVYPRYSQLFGELKTVRDRLETDYNTLQEKTEKEAMALAGMEGEGMSAARKYLTAYTNRTAAGMLYEWMELGKRLMVKYIDGTVRPERDGQYVRTPGGLGVPVERPGYPERYRREIVKATGDRFEVK